MELKPIRVLHIEDGPGDAELIRLVLSRLPKGSFELRQVDRLSAGLALVAQGGIDVILLDLSLPDSLGLTTLKKARARSGNVPIVVMTGLDDPDISLAAVAQGAQDYLIKGQVTPDSLSRILRGAVERKTFDRPGA